MVQISSVFPELYKIECRVGGSCVLVQSSSHAYKDTRIYFALTWEKSHQTSANSCSIPGCGAKVSEVWVVLTKAPPFCSSDLGNNDLMYVYSGHVSTLKGGVSSTPIPCQQSRSSSFRSNRSSLILASPISTSPTPFPN